MKITEILFEKPVQSTWITDLVHTRAKNTVTMRLSNGISYLIPGITRTEFERWVNYPSKGEYFHNNIRGKHQVSKIK